MEHYYTPPENINDKTLIIKDDEAKHLSKVLRKKTGTEIFVTDGIGNLYKCNIEEINKKEIICRISEKQSDINEPSIKLSAYISVLKNPARFEFAVEKLTELGVYSIRPIITEYVISKEKDKSWRWQLIALSAMKQSQRCLLPKVFSPIGFETAIKNCKDDAKLIAHEKQNNSGFRISDIGFENNQSAALFIGPEGGFTDGEINFAESNGFKVISLGSRKYRSETAAIAAASLILIH